MRSKPMAVMRSKRFNLIPRILKLGIPTVVSIITLYILTMF